MTPTQEDHEAAARKIVQQYYDHTGMLDKTEQRLADLIAAALSEAVRVAVEKERTENASLRENLRACQELRVALGSNAVDLLQERDSRGCCLHLQGQCPDPETGPLCRCPPGFCLLHQQPGTCSLRERTLVRFTPPPPIRSDAQATPAPEPEDLGDDDYVAGEQAEPLCGDWIFCLMVNRHLTCVLPTGHEYGHRAEGFGWRKGHVWVEDKAALGRGTPPETGEKEPSR